MLLPYKQNPCCKNQAYWRMVLLVRSAWRPRHASCQYYAQSRRGRRDKRGFPSRHPQFTPHGTHNLFSKAAPIHSARHPQFCPHGAHNLFSKAFFFRFAWRPRHALCPHFTQSRRGRRDKPGFPSWHPQFIQKSVLISLRMASSPCVSSKSESSRHGKQTS